MKKRSFFIVLIIAMVLIPCAIASAAYYHVSGTSWLKLRQLPSTEAKVLATYRQDYAVVQYSKFDKNWAYVHYSDGHEGYVMTKYLKSDSAYYAYITEDSVALRNGPAASYSSVSTLAKGTKVRVLTHGSAWDYVADSSGTGYVRNSKLSKKKPAVTPGTTATPYTAYVVNPNYRSVNVRSGAGKGYGVLAQLKPGTAVTVTQVLSGWSKITTSSVTGYMMNEFLSKKQPVIVEPSPAPEYIVETPAPASSYTAYITSGNGKKVNIRGGAGKGHAVKIQLPVGTEITVLPDSKTAGWLHIQYATVKGYVMSQFVTTSVPSVVPDPPVIEQTVTYPFLAYITSENGKSVNVRRGAGIGYAADGSLPVGTVVQVLGHSDTWYKIESGSLKGYVMKKFITTEYTAPVIEQPTEPGGTGDTIIGTKVVYSENGEPVNLRRGPGLGYSHLARIEVGTVVNVLKNSGDWYYIEVEGKKGYMNSAFLK